MNIIDKTKQDLSLIASAIREKTGLTDKMLITEMPDMIDAIGNVVVGDEVVDSIIGRTITSFTPSEYEMTTIPSYFFEKCSSLTEVDLTGVTEIEPYSFSESGIKQVIFPATLTSLQGNTFSSCTDLTYVKYKDFDSVDKTAFWDCPNLNVDFSETTYILKNAFYDNTSITNLDLTTVTSIGETAFLRCRGLQTINFGNSITISSRGFKDCTSLEKITSSSDTLTLSGPNAFYQCSTLTEITPVLRFENSSEVSFCFFGCTSLSNYSVKGYIDENCFRGCADFPKIEGNISLGAECFAYNKGENFSLNEYYIISLLGKNIFGGCPNLKSLDLILNPATITAQVFSNIPALKTLKLKKRTTTAGTINSGNLNSPLLEEIYLTNYKKITFDDVGPTNLSSFTIDFVDTTQATVVPLDNSTYFASTKIANGEGYIYVPEALVEDYKIATNWTVYADQIMPIPTETTTTEEVSE